jgi:propionyl-CoA synthetase
VTKWVEAPRGVFGNVVVKLPLPPGTTVFHLFSVYRFTESGFKCLLFFLIGAFSGLWGNRSGFIKSYFTRFPGYYDTTDGGYIGEFFSVYRGDS